MASAARRAWPIRSDSRGKSAAGATAGGDLTAAVALLGDEARFDLLGLDYSAPSTDFVTMSATGKPVIAYLIGDQAAEASAAGVGESGFMVSAVREVVPPPTNNAGR